MAAGTPGSNAPHFPEEMTGRAWQREWVTEVQSNAAQPLGGVRLHGHWMDVGERSFKESEEGAERRQDRKVEVSTADKNIELLESRLVRSPLLPLQRPLHYHDNLIPYAFLSADGPVLMLLRSSRPFYKVASLDPYSPVLFPRQSIWMPNSAILEPSKVESSILGLELLDWISNTPDCFQFRLEIIKWIQNRLLNIGLATRDDTIGAVMTLIMWESHRSILRRSDLVSHMDGLELLVNLRGGLDRMPPAQAAKLALFDHIIATMTLQQPRFPLRSGANVTPSSQPRFYDSPLYGSLPFSSFVKSTGANIEICALLETLRDITDAAFSNIPFRPLLLHIKKSCPTDPIHKVIHAAAQIYASALSVPSFFNSPLSRSWLEILSTNLDLMTGAPFWRENPGVRLWVLLVGAAAAVERAERGYFMMYLARVSMFQQSWENEMTFRKWCVLFSARKAADSGDRGP